MYFIISWVIGVYRNRNCKNLHFTPPPPFFHDLTHLVPFKLQDRNSFRPKIDELNIFVWRFNVFLDIYWRFFKFKKNHTGTDFVVSLTLLSLIPVCHWYCGVLETSRDHSSFLSWPLWCGQRDNRFKKIRTLKAKRIINQQSCSVEFLQQRCTNKWAISTF